MIMVATVTMVTHVQHYSFVPKAKTLNDTNENNLLVISTPT